ncbi:neurotrophin 1 [Chironomus tepperi]|uniref:neurotrophin 1 n=1 Tax=Chironomus tepperi TaxID=113505 RepID=UPI00391F42F1
MNYRIEMSLMKAFILCIITLSVIRSAKTRNLDDEIPDFEFDDNFPNNKFTIQKPQTTSLNIDDFDDFFIDDGTDDNTELDMLSKEKILRNAILRALSTRELKYKFSEVLPLLRHLSKTQRMVFSSIISAQINGGRSVSFDEVKRMFGTDNEKPLLLTIVYDLANLIREGFLRSDKYKEHEKPNRLQFLRRSFDTSPPINSSSVKEVDFSAPISYLHDDSLIVDDSEPIVKNIENLSDIKAEPLIQILNKNLTINNSIPATLTRSQLNSTLITTTALPKNFNMTMEQVEELALSSLNGTIEETIKDVNGSEISPMALVSRHRKRPANQRHHHGPIPESCERFTGGICLYVKNYPVNEIMGSIRRHRYAMEALLAEYRDKEAEFEHIDYLGDPTSDLTDLRRRKDTEDSSNPGAMCTSIIRYARPQKARSATGEWKFIVNTGEHTQTLRLEKCSQPLEPCSYLTENFESQCTQVYNYHRLLSWDNARGLHVDIFKVPTCCSCHLVGYKEAFPPLASPSNSLGGKRHKYHDFESASSNRNSHYSAIDVNGSENDEEDEEDEDENIENIAYQYGNGFKRINPKKTPDNNPEVPKNRLPTRKNPAYPDSYLTPPANSQKTNHQFNRFSNRQRTPVLKRKQFDQTVAESDLRISHVTVFPKQQQFSPSEKPRKITPPISSTIETKSVNLRLPNAQKPSEGRVNYNYHPIIDFFEDEDGPKRIGIDRKTGKVVTEDTNWKPINVG